MVRLFFVGRTFMVRLVFCRADLYGPPLVFVGRTFMVRLVFVGRTFMVRLILL